MVYEDYLMRALSGSEKRETVFDGSRFLYAAVTFVTANMTDGIFRNPSRSAIIQSEAEQRALPAKESLNKSGAQDASRLRARLPGVVYSAVP